ncbi:MAG: hypothetical protein PHQ89_02325 [Bacilli bacterium]|nr:hypothetical protein [Bacilli bacterium]
MKKILKLFTIKNVIIGIAVVIWLLIVMIGNSNSQQTENFQNEIKDSKQTENKVVICDGINITENCEIDGIKYLKYQYYPPVKEISHIETQTTYTKEITGYCTLCNDGTRSPSCSTGRGTCSHHGGVAQWNAPIYSTVSHYEQIKVIDSPAIAERYEKVIK